MDETLEKLGQTIAGALGGAVSGHQVVLGELTVTANAAVIVKVVRFLRDDPACQFWSIIDVTAIDWPAREQRFEVVYHFLSPKQNCRVRVKVTTDESAPVPSIIGVFPGADWFERETYDLYGVLFTGHPDMRRLLTDYGFEGHPLRKDFPLTGFVEVRYDDDRAADERRGVVGAGDAGHDGSPLGPEIDLELEQLLRFRHRLGRRDPGDPQIQRHEGVERDARRAFGRTLARRRRRRLRDRFCRARGGLLSHA